MPYSQQFTASGGTGSYTFGWGGTLPPGLSIDSNGLLSGTPTQSGSFAFAIAAEEIVAGETVNFGIRDYTMDVKYNGEFTFTSAPNPSAPGQEVVFTVTATGDAIHPELGPVPPYGWVRFLADGVTIAGCEMQPLNIPPSEGDPIDSYPAECRTTTLSSGLHQITILFFDNSRLYNNATLTLPGGQMVGYFYTISGTFFHDLDYDRARDTGEEGLAGKQVYIKLCDTPDSQAWPADLTDDNGAYTTPPQLGGGCYTIFSKLGYIPATWAYTLFPQIDSLGGNMTGVNIGAAEVAFSPTGFPDGTVGVAYNQTVTPRGGIGPFSILYAEGEGPFLPAGLTNSFDPQTGAMTLSGTPTASGMFFYEATLRDSVGSEFPLNSQYDIAPAPVTSADLQLTKVDSTDPVKAGAALMYTLNLTNLGPDPADSPKLVDTLDTNTTYVKIAKPKGWTCTVSAGVVTCNATSLASGKTATFYLTVMVNRTTTSGTVLANTAVASSMTYDPNMANNTVTQETTVKRK